MGICREEIVRLLSSHAVANRGAASLHKNALAHQDLRVCVALAVPQDREATSFVQERPVSRINDKLGASGRNRSDASSRVRAGMFHSRSRNKWLPFVTSGSSVADLDCRKGRRCPGHQVLKSVSIHHALFLMPVGGTQGAQRRAPVHVHAGGLDCGLRGRRSSPLRSHQ